MNLRILTAKFQYDFNMSGSSVVLLHIHYPCIKEKAVPNRYLNGQNYYLRTPGLCQEENSINKKMAKVPNLILKPFYKNWRESIPL